MKLSLNFAHNASERFLHPVCIESLACVDQGTMPMYMLISCLYAQICDAIACFCSVFGVQFERPECMMASAHP